jgi:Oxidoreductase molybdopterin binding domain.
MLHVDPALNGEPDPALLGEPITPISAFFVRNNGTLPSVGDIEQWRLRIDGEVNQPKNWSIAELQRDF